MKIHEKPGWTVCEITDNGVGRKKAIELNNTFPEGHLSKAVNIIRQRLSEHNRSPDVEAVSFIDLEEGGVIDGTTVVVRIKSS